jgi:hypothetical protein
MDKETKNNLIEWLLGAFTGVCVMVLVYFMVTGS